MDFVKPKKIIHEIIPAHDYFPGNPNFPLLIYPQVFSSDVVNPELIKDKLTQNQWCNAWVDSIYDFHHYHSNTHEVLVILSGNCQVQFGGEKGIIHTVTPGDVVIIPAGVAHKSLQMSNDFRCIGAYPLDIDYDMNYGTKNEYEKACQSIKQLGLPPQDPIFGKEGPLFSYWK